MVTIRYYIKVYSHGLFVHVPIHADRAAVMDYCRELTQTEYVWVPHLRRKIKKTKAIFATATHDRRVFGFLAVELPNLKRHLMLYGCREDEINVDTITPYRGDRVGLTLEPGVAPRDDEQRDVLEFIKSDDSRRSIVLGLSTGHGKFTNLDAKIRIPGGWSTMGAMTVGTVVTTQDGSATTVCGVYPQGKQAVYKVTFADGRSVEAGLEHQWLVRRGNAGLDEVLNTGEVIHQMGLGYSFSIPTIVPEVGNVVNLPIPPKTLGHRLALDSTEVENNHIPPIYLEANVKQRWILLWSIVDISDSVGMFNTPYHQLAKDVQYLVRSLGGLAWLEDGAEDTFTVLVSLTIQTCLPLTDEVRLGIRSIAYTRTVETQCIAVAHPSYLYITNDFIVTHNTAISLMAAAHFDTRIGLSMSSRHIETWMRSIGWTLGLTKDDVFIVRGRKSLEGIIALGKAGENNYKMIFFSISTLRSYLNEYLLTGYMAHGVPPNQIMEVLGIGLKIVDEAHENIHSLYRDAIHTHVARTIYLSATMISDDSFIQRQYDKLFPFHDRFKGSIKNNHTVAVGLFYNNSDVTERDYKGTRGYSHTSYENYLMGDVNLVNNYCDLIKDVVDKYYMVDYEVGQRCLIYCATIDLCSIVAERLRFKYSDTALKIADYTGEHDVDVLYNNDIIVSTMGSAGTGKDIPGLKNAINTVAVNSIQQNLQSLGRLRIMKDWPDVNPVYIWFSCRDIVTHKIYHDNKVKLQFPGNVKSISVVESTVDIGVF